MAKWRPLQPVTHIPNPASDEALIQDAMRRSPAVPRAEFERIMESERALPLYRNLDYQVAVRRWTTTADDGSEVPLFHLSIKRIDRKPVRDWRDLQRIKNELIGSEVEAVEIFPAESRLLDTANQYHLWGVEDPTYRIPFGLHGGRTVIYDMPAGVKAQQRGPRPSEEEAQP